MKWYYDKGVQEIPFKVGDKVLLSSRDYQTTERSLAPRYIGPFEIVDKISEVTFKLKMPPQYRSIHPVFHASKLVPYTESEIPGQKPPPPKPVRRGKHEEYVVEKILQHKVSRRKNYYLVKWEGYPDATWEPQEHVEKGARKAIEQFHHARGHKAPWEMIRSLESEEDDYKALLTRDTTLQIEQVDNTNPVTSCEEATGIYLYASQKKTIPANSRSLIPTGLKIKLPIGTCGRVIPMVDLSLKGIDVAADYLSRDFKQEVRVLLHNTTDSAFEINAGDQIAQLIVERTATVDLEILENLE